MLVSRIKKILLAKMAKLRAHFPCNVQIVVDDQPHIRRSRNRHNRLCNPPDFFNGATGVSPYSGKTPDPTYAWW